MKIRWVTAVSLVIALSTPALGQQAPTGDQDVIKARQGLADRFAVAVANKTSRNRHEAIG